MTETVERRLPYIERVEHQIRELGSICSGDIYYLMKNIPPTESPTSLNLKLRASKDTMPGTKTTIGHDYDGKLTFDKINFFGSSLDSLLKKGKVEELDINWPKWEDGQKGLFMVPKAVESLRRVLGTLQQEGYEILLPDFRLGQFAVETKTPSHLYKFFSRAIDAELRFETKQLVEGEDPRKLVFLYTTEAMKTPEFEAWTKVLDEIKKSKIVPKDDR